MRFSDTMREDLDILFSAEELAVPVRYVDATQTIDTTAHVFNEPSAMGDAVVTIIKLKVSDIPNFDNATGVFYINGVTFGVISHSSDEYGSIMEVLTQKGRY